jgi:hypothetical protein
MNAVVNFKAAEDLRDRLPEKKAPKKLSALTGSVLVSPLHSM